MRKQALKPESAIKKSDKMPYPASTSGLKLPVFFIAFLSALLTLLLLEEKSTRDSKLSFLELMRDR